MRTNVPVKLTVSPEAIQAWALEYGIEPTAAAVREDLHRYVRETVRAQICDVVGISGITVELS